MQDSWSRDYKEVQQFHFSSVIVQTVVRVWTFSKNLPVIFLPSQRELA